MIAYGKTKTGNTLHDTNRCGVCESHKDFSGKCARQAAKREIRKELNEFYKQGFYENRGDDIQ